MFWFTQATVGSHKEFVDCASQIPPPSMCAAVAGNDFYCPCSLFRSSVALIAPPTTSLRSSPCTHSWPTELSISHKSAPLCTTPALSLGNAVTIKSAPALSSLNNKKISLLLPHSIPERLTEIIKYLIASDTDCSSRNEIKVGLSVCHDNCNSNQSPCYRHLMGLPHSNLELCPTSSTKHVSFSRNPGKLYVINLC